MAIWIASILLFVAASYGGRQLLLRHRMAVQARAHRALQSAREASAPLEDTLGTFTCDGNAWSAHATTARGPVRMAIYNVNREELPAILERHRAFAAATLADDSAVRLVAASERLAAYNATWRKDGPELDTEQLASELSLHSVRLPSVAREGPFLIFRAAPSVFGGHGIELALDEAYKPRAAQ